MSDPLSVLLVEPWFGGSHQAWAEGLQRYSAHNVDLLTLPAEAWRWRMRGSAITLAERLSQTPDVLIASSLLDVPAFLGHARAWLSDVPVVLYMHENQLTYPLPEGAKRDTGLAYINWASQVAADAVVFNSEFHRADWFEALGPLLQSYPEPGHAHLVDVVRHRSSVLPVGVELAWLDSAARQESTPPLLLWNQRWEHDKDPETLAWAVERLMEGGRDFEVAICGESALGVVPESLARLPDLLGARLVHFGFADRALYEQLLASASVVVSTARHEFFGVAIVEAMAAGAYPVLPDRLSYPGLIPADVHPHVLYTSRDQLLERLESAIMDPHPQVVPRTSAAARSFDWRVVAAAYDALLESAASA